MSIKHIKLNRLQNFPISFLAILLGLIGFTLAYVKAENILVLPFELSNYLLYFTIGISIIIIATYLLKIIKYPKEIKKEWNNPIKINFYPILAKLFLISSIIYLEIDLITSKYLWWTGVIIQSILSLIIMSSWIRHTKYNINHVNPSWFIPIVGTLIIPIAGIKHFSAELSWFFFSVGIMWWLILFVIVIYKIIFHEPIPNKLIPTFFIMFAPPAIGFISYVKLIGDITPFAKILYYFSLFMFILIIYQVKLFTRIEFYLSWWAYSFPVVALTIATLLMYHMTKLSFFNILSWIMFIFLNMVLLMLLLRTTYAIFKKTICIEEEKE